MDKKGTLMVSFLFAKRNYIGLKLFRMQRQFYITALITEVLVN